jgi:hypothetical protein
MQDDRWVVPHRPGVMFSTYQQRIGRTKLELGSIAQSTLLRWPVAEANGKRGAYPLPNFFARYERIVASYVRKVEMTQVKGSDFFASYVRIDFFRTLREKSQHICDFSRNVRCENATFLV